MPKNYRHEERHIWKAPKRKNSVRHKNGKHEKQRPKMKGKKGREIRQIDR
jgi:hypothetical protein